ncbi:hypothetical protein [Planomonospora sp. ID82291]|uniref:hypothetical protein n=1 Tax=Planomonospora sp. ID82291 TaxID=2738136 RepID=UPI0018C355FB|nr:hypothetical protein [Planomonospora sp. ID82291]MBG0812788.1 hypothetical protein [Planomonospora sp. ID82291]
MENERDEQRFDLPALMAQLERSMSGVRGIDEFVGAGAAFVKGEEQDIETTVERMMSFFDGEVGGYSTERQRLVLLAQTMRKRAGGVPIFMLTFTTCSEVLSCSYACC